MDSNDYISFTRIIAVVRRLWTGATGSRASTCPRSRPNTGSGPGAKTGASPSAGASPCAKTGSGSSAGSNYKRR